jgi:hypothetical protein
MILGNGDGAATEHAPTLDELFRRAGVRHPQAIALIDPPNRKSFTDGAPRTLTCAEADALISAFVAAIPDGIVGERLASTGSNPQAIVSALLARGANPLVAAAFRVRGEADAAASPSGVDGVLIARR